MTTIDPTFTIEDEDTGVDPTTAQMRGVLVLKGATINFVIPNTEGIEGATWSIIGKSAHFTAPTITPAGTPTGITASCVVPNMDGIACGVLVRARAAGGVVRTYVGKFYTALDGGVDAEPFFDGEKNWGYKLNERLADLEDRTSDDSSHDWTFTTGDYNVAVEESEEPQEITLATLDFADLPNQHGTAIEYGGGDPDANCTGYIEGWVCMLDGGSGAGTNKEWWFTQKVQRRAGGNIETRGPIFFDPRSEVFDDENEDDFDPEFAFINGSTMGITMTTPIPNNVTRLVVRLRGKLTNQVRA